MKKTLKELSWKIALLAGVVVFTVWTLPFLGCYQPVFIVVFGHVASDIVEMNLFAHYKRNGKKK